ncbi:MAG TPA: hypothetical protein VIC08_12090, partial [Cellvibrionaceae bacterium]
MKRHPIYSAVLLSLLLLITTCLSAETDTGLVVTYRMPESATDQRHDYETELLRLVLEKTLKQYGPYQLQPGFAMNLPRAISMARNNEAENLFFKTSYSEVLNQEFAYLPYPLDRGVLGYRVCFVNKDVAEKISQITHVEELKKYTIGQGVGWLDSAILQHNGFQVVESENYANLFLMLAAGRIDLFCRGATEIEAEWQAHRELEGLALDESFALYYPLPRFFWTHTENKVALERINKGLVIALADGSAKTLWQKHHGGKLDFAKLQQRRIFTLENPNVKTINIEYRHFF